MECTATLNSNSWPVIVKIKEESENFVVANIAYHGSSYDICVMRYFYNPLFGGGDYAVFIPEANFGCKVVYHNDFYNFEKLSQHTSFKVDILSEIVAINAILELWE